MSKIQSLVLREQETHELLHVVEREGDAEYYDNVFSKLRPGDAYQPGNWKFWARCSDILPF